MPLLLAIDTSAKPVSCALAQDGRIIGSFYAHTGLTHSQTLMPMMEQMLAIAGVEVAQLDAVAVAAGPGSFTGVRIGVSAVKGMCFTHNIPCLSVSTLEAMAEQVAAPGAIVCSVMDARCQQVYTAQFARDAAGQTVRLTPDEAIPLALLGERLAQQSQPILLVGDGSELCYEALHTTLPQLHLATAAVRFQHAAGVAAVALRQYERGQTLSAEELLPLYLRLPQAERELNERLSKSSRPNDEG